MNAYRRRAFAQRIAASIAALATIAVCSAAQAVILEDFQFNDADGTALNVAANSASPRQWVHDTDHVATIQVLNGALNIVKNNTDFVTEGLGIDDVTTGPLWMVAEFANWAVLGTAPDANNVEEIRFGFMGTEDLIPPPSSTVLAEMQISRNFGAGTFEILGSALGAAGESIPPATINLVQNAPFIMAMEVDQTANTYSIWYKDGANPYVQLGTRNVEPTRDAIVVRMTINNFWGDVTGESANLDRFYVSTTPPPGIPEPSAGLLGALGTAGIAGRRRRAA